MLNGSKLGKKGKVVPFLPTAEYYFNKGIMAFDRFDMVKATKYLTRALELEPGESMIACQLALVYTETGEYTRSNDLLFKVINEIDELMTECHYFIANNYAHLGQFAEAHKHARLYLDLDKTGEFAADAQELLDLIGFVSEEYDMNVEHDEIFYIQENSKHLLESGQYIDAINMLEDAITQHPDFWPAYNNLSLAYFYNGEKGKALGTLEKVLSAVPGNLHALCNLAVFLHYEQQVEQLDQLMLALEKVKPISYELQFKLGATFALTGRYEPAYRWLRNVKKYGYDEEPSYLYWMAKSAYHLGYEKEADEAWKQLRQLDPNKGKIAPWNIESDVSIGETDEHQTIYRLLHHHRLEKRLYAIFLMSMANDIKQIITHDHFKPIEEFSLLEKLYLSYVLETLYKDHVDAEAVIIRGHEIARLLYKRYVNDKNECTSILIAWFSAYIHGLKLDESFNNAHAFAAATEYIWLKERSKSVTQKGLATIYSLSTSTLSKYIKIMNGYWK